MKAILLRNTHQRQHFVHHLVNLIRHKTVRKGQGLTRKMFFNTRREISCLRGHVISSIYSSSKFKTKLEVISRYHEVVYAVSFHEIAETSRKVTNLYAQSCPETSASFHNYFSCPELPWVTVAQLGNPSTYSHF